MDYNEIFAPVVDSTSISLLLAIANQEGWEIEQMDVVTAFLHGRLNEEICMRIPPFMEIEGGAEGKVLRMRGALYGLKLLGVEYDGAPSNLGCKCTHKMMVRMSR